MNEIIISENIEILSKNLTEDLFKVYSQKSQSNIFNLAISGGNTPKKLFDFISQNYKNRFNWGHINIFWVDERCVEPNSDQSNYFMTKKHLLDNIDIPLKNIYRIKGELDPDKEVLRYSDEIKENVKIINDYPQFDYIILGMGDDGHTASIFPDNTPDLYLEDICFKAIKPESKQIRISLSLKTINNAKNISFMITGKEKAKVLREVIENNNKIYPASFIKNNHLKFFIDTYSSDLLLKK